MIETRSMIRDYRPNDNVVMSFDRINRETEWSEIVAATAPLDIQEFADTIFQCNGCCRLLSWLFRRARTSNTHSDLIRLVIEQADEPYEPLQKLVAAKIIHSFEAGGVTFYSLTQEPAILIKIARFMEWRARLLTQAEWLAKNLEADNFQFVIA